MHLHDAARGVGDDPRVPVCAYPGFGEPGLRRVRERRAHDRAAGGVVDELAQRNEGGVRILDRLGLRTACLGDGRELSHRAPDGRAFARRREEEPPAAIVEPLDDERRGAQ